MAEAAWAGDVSVYGLNDLKILITDINGKTETLYYSTTYNSDLLPKGIHDYSLNFLNKSSVYIISIFLGFIACIESGNHGIHAIKNTFVMGNGPVGIMDRHIHSLLKLLCKLKGSKPLIHVFKNILPWTLSAGVKPVCVNTVVME